MMREGLVINQRATDTPEQVLKFAPKENASNRVAQLHDAGEAIVAQIRTAADLAKEDCDRAMGLAHKLSMELRAAEDRTQQMAREVERWRDRAARAEQWLRKIQQDIEENLLSRRPSFGGEEAAIR
jgi:gas vesicle protein